MPRLGLSLLEDSDFNKFGCSARCAFRLIEHLNSGVSFQDFIAKSRGYFTPNEFGALSDGNLVGLCISVFDIASGFSAIRRKDTVRRIFKSGVSAGVFVITDYAFDGSQSEIFHTQLLLGFDKQDRWVVLNPNGNGTNYRTHYSDSDLERFLPHFLILDRPFRLAQKLTDPIDYSTLIELSVP